MIKITGIAALIFYTGVVSLAQSNDYYSLKEVKTYRFDHLELKDDKDAGRFLDDPAGYNFIEAIKIGNTTKLDLILKGSGICSYIKEIDLTSYTGDFGPGTFDSCRGTEILHIRISEDRLDRLKYLNGMKGLQTLYLYIDGRPESLTELSFLPVLRELHIIGEFLPNDLAGMTGHLQHQNSLQVLGLSIDRITDLPQSITRFKTLSRLNLYDNLSVYTSKGIDDLSEEKLSIIFNLYTDAISAIAVSYFSTHGKLADFETEYLQNLFKGELLPQQFTETEEDEKGNKYSPFKKQFIPDYPATPEFSSPYPKIFPPSEIFVLQPGVNSIVYSLSGMKITVAAGSFVNAEGADITDPVYLKVVQMVTPTDLLFAGVALSNGERQFCPSYVFNIQASTERSAVRLKEGYQIRVALPSQGDSSEMFFFDYESNTWQDLHFYNRVFAPSLIPIDFYRIENGSDQVSCYQFDTSAFATRFGSGDNYLLNDRNNNGQMLFRLKHYYTDLDRTWKKDYNRNGKLKGIRIKKGKSYVKVQKVIPKVRNRSRQYFKILDKTEIGVLAELSAIRNINFNVPFDAENKKEFTENYVRGAKFYDVFIHYEKGKETCEITFKTAVGFKKLTAFITDTEDKKLIKKQLLKFYKAFRKYERIRAARETEFNTLNQSRFEEFKTYSNQKINDLQKNNALFEIKIPHLGTFGLLSDSLPSFSTNIIARYTDESGLPIDVRDLFMVDSRYNTVFRIEPGNISFSPAFCSLIVATDYSGNLYYANRNDVSASNLSDNSLTYIRLKKVSPGITGIGMFQQLIRY